MLQKKNSFLLALGTGCSSDFQKVFIVDHLLIRHQRWRLVFIKHCPQILQETTD